MKAYWNSGAAQECFDTGVYLGNFDTACILDIGEMMRLLFSRSQEHFDGM